LLYFDIITTHRDDNVPFSKVVCSLLQCTDGGSKSRYVDVLIIVVISVNSLLQRRQLLADACGQLTTASLHNTDQPNDSDM